MPCTAVSDYKTEHCDQGDILYFSDTLWLYTCRAIQIESSDNTSSGLSIKTTLRLINFGKVASVLDVIIWSRLSVIWEKINHINCLGSCEHRKNMALPNDTKVMYTYFNGNPPHILLMNLYNKFTSLSIYYA